MQALARADLSVDELVAATGQDPDQARDALRVLLKHDVVMEQDGVYCYTVKLMREWVGKEQQYETAERI